jgi:hypothetical protein
MFIIPKPDIIVRDPVSKKAVAAKGRHVDDYDVYWHRRIRDKDVSIGEPAAKPAATTPAPAAASAADATVAPAPAATKAPSAP